jgi:hypothetical protein
MDRAPAKWPKMKYPDEPWIQNSDKAGEMGDVGFGLRINE